LITRPFNKSTTLPFNHFELQYNESLGKFTCLGG
jgi:hypothetical protein